MQEIPHTTRKFTRTASFQNTVNVKVYENAIIHLRTLLTTPILNIDYAED